jgi:aldehyde:ferredoxin oxidoreductase
MHEQAHTLGRGGMGAVFGSKMIKALSVTSQGPLKPKVSEQFMTTRREVARLATEAPVSVNYRRFGTPMMVSIVNEAGAFPTDFFTRGVVEHRGTLEAETWPSWAKVETEGCPPCPIRCRKRLTLLEGPDAGRQIHGPEYETIYAFGGSCMVKHARDVARLNETCNLLGLDTISTANLIGLAVKGGELGLLGNVPASGDVEAFDELLGQVACRSTSIGDALAVGLDSAAQRFGMSGWNITSKGLDPAGYEPRRLKSMALSYALSARGACHLRATFYKAEFGGLLEGLDDEAYVETYVDQPCSHQHSANAPQLTIL